MRVIVDTEARTLTEETNGEVRRFDLYSKEAFERISRHWVRVGWSEKYQYANGAAAVERVGAQTALIRWINTIETGSRLGRRRLVRCF